MEYLWKSTIEKIVLFFAQKKVLTMPEFVLPDHCYGGGFHP